MNNNLMMFEENEVEIFEFEGKVLFNPKHVAKCLELSEDARRKQIQRMSEKQVIKLTNSKVTNCPIRKLHNTGENFLTESGVYKMIFASRSSEAEKFQDWVTDEVLPMIRKTGGFVEDEREEEFIHKYFPSFSEDVKLAMVQDLLKTNKELKGKADCFDRFLDKDGTYNFQNTAKMISTIAKEENIDISISVSKLTEYLREIGILCKTKKSKGGYKNLPRKEYEEYFNVVPVQYNGYSDSQCFVKPKGIEFIYNILKEKVS